MIGEIKGKALITGASSGIGAVYADRLAKQGYDLILVARNADKLSRLGQSITRSTGRFVQILQADLVDPEELRRVETVLRTNQGISLLVNNAGVGATQPLLESDVNAMEAMIDLNVTALMRLAYAAAPTFVARGGGTIVNIASVVGIVPELLNGVYGASKAFVIALSQSLHHELAGRGVRIQAVLPGATATGFWDVAGTPLEALPTEMVMTAEALVDAALAGLEQGELITIPSLPDVSDWERLEAARIALKPNLSRTVPAARYSVPSDAHDLRALAHA
jgi:hypothetical protein